jgi:hypothetical protein
LRRGWLKYTANNFLGQPSGFCLKRILGGLLLFFDFCFSLLDLRLCPGSRLRNRFRSRLRSLRAP